jgi:RHS repeat-associated protein
MWSVGSTNSAWGYTGEWYDASAEMLYLRARWYQPQVGRFTRRDLIRQNHPYQYAEANPVNLVDPSGWDAGEGILIHGMIQSHYLANYAQGRVIIPEYRILGASKEGTGNPGRADIADVTLQQLYEIKPIAAEAIGESDLTWYLSFLPGWTPGTIYPSTPTLIGPWPGSPTRQVYAQMRLPGVIVYWGRSMPSVPEPIPVFEWDWEEILEDLRREELEPIVVTCGVVVVVGATVVILADPIVGDELLLPMIWAPILMP